MFTKKLKNSFILLFILQTNYSTAQDSLARKFIFSIENDIALASNVYFANRQKNSSFERTPLYSIGSINLELNTTNKSKYGFFLGYVYQLDKFIFNEKSASFLVGRVYEEKESSFYIIPGVSLKRVLKNKKVSGFYTSIGIGGGQEILKGDNYLYNSRTAWCNSIDVGYIIGFKHFYLKPFVGLLSIFNFKEFIDYNNGEVISTGKLNYYSQNNPEKTNLYKSSTSPNPAQILIKYKYAGLTNATFLPRGLFSIGFTF